MITLTMEQFHHLILIPALIFAIIYAAVFPKHYRISRLRALFYTVIMVALGYAGVYLAGSVYNLFLSWRGQPATARMNVFGAIYAVFFGTLFLILLEKGLRALFRKCFKKNIPDVSLRDTWDFLETGAFVFVMFIKCRCLWAGCCYGIPCNWGIHSFYAKERVFPVQLVEVLLVLFSLIAVYYLKQTAFFRRGMALFLAAGIHSTGRFFLEYLMYYKPEDRTFLGFFTFWQCAAVIVIIVCIGIIVYLYKTQPAEPMPGKLRPIIEEREVIREKKQKEKAPRKKQSVSQKKYSKGWQSTKKKYKKKK